ncbi:hypothetical protein HK102_007008 [Quaeritorhiza haematococci]|nr:hypothetical protein HK102_007008 [Quaeritorhiza haematococci]
MEKKELLCCMAIESRHDKFTVPYDKLVIAVGSYSNTFGIPGVAEHALFLKEVSHAVKIRRRIIECFELASQPNVSGQEQSDIDLDQA